MNNIRNLESYKKKHFTKTNQSKEKEMKFKEQLAKAQKFLILSSSDGISNMNHIELKKHSKKSNVFNLINDRLIANISACRGDITDLPNVRSIECNNFKFLFDETREITVNSRYLENLEKFKISLTPEFLKNNELKNRHLIEEFHRTVDLNRKYNDSDIYISIKKKINSREIGEADMKNKRLRTLKIKACVLKFDKKLSNKIILQKLPLTINQLKDAFKNYRKSDIEKVVTEKRGIHKKKDSIRTLENLEYIRSILKDSDKRLTIKEIQNRFQNEKLGFKCSKSIVHKMITEDLGFKFGLSKAEHQNKNSFKNKVYRFDSVGRILHSFVNNHLVISIDETGFSDYIEKNKLWHDPTGKCKMKISKKKQSVTLSLLLAVSEEKILYYYIVEGPVTSVIYMNFIKMMLIDYDLYDSIRQVTIIMDNARIHRAAAVKYIMINSRKIHFLFTAAYSPEINFIENVFNRIKNRYRKSVYETNK